MITNKEILRRLAEIEAAVDGIEETFKGRLADMRQSAANSTEEKRRKIEVRLARVESQCMREEPSQRLRGALGSLELQVKTT
ncbi:MAG TPA: hypothetical protein VEY51_19675 [Chondromyces sp.]|nr:hypothetical protein [Chondromyces sp.]